MACEFPDTATRYVRKCGIETKSGVASSITLGRTAQREESQSFMSAAILVNEVEFETMSTLLLQNHNWYTRPSIAEDGDIITVTLKANCSYQIRARLSRGAAIGFVSQDARDDATTFMSLSNASASRQIVRELWQIRPVGHDREVELWFGFKKNSKDEERFEFVAVERLPQGGATAGSPPQAVWQWST